MPVRDFAEKLKLTAALLGCATQKDLCLLFRKVNPETEFDLERSYNWVQGRSRPRSAKVYEDWATLLGTNRPTGFLTSCSMDAFLDVIAQRFEMSRAELARMAGYQAAEAEPARTTNRPPAYLAGCYACYSHAWSPHFRGMIVRGSLAIDSPAAQDTPPSLIAAYSELVAVGHLQLRGAVEITGRSITVDLSDADHQLRLHMTLFPPSPPASVLAGVMSGAAFVDSLAQPAATPIVMVRIPQAKSSAIEISDRYLDVAEEPMSGDLAALGVPVGKQAAEIDRLLHAFLWSARESDSHIEAAASAYADLTLEADRLMLPLLQPAAPPPRPRVAKRPA